MHKFGDLQDYKNIEARISNISCDHKRFCAKKHQGAVVGAKFTFLYLFFVVKLCYSKLKGNVIEENVGKKGLKSKPQEISEEPLVVVTQKL